MNQIKVVSAIIIFNNKVLCTQRPNAGEAALKWEFPGGKIEAFETPESAIIREIKEELDCDIHVKNFYMTVRYQYKTFHLTMYSYICTLLSDEIILREHINSCWLPINELHTLDWAPADIPIVEKLQKMEVNRVL